jgi:hypothetical protein
MPSLTRIRRQDAHANTIITIRMRISSVWYILTPTGSQEWLMARR